MARVLDAEGVLRRLEVGSTVEILPRRLVVVPITESVLRRVDVLSDNAVDEPEASGLPGSGFELMAVGAPGCSFFGGRALKEPVILPASFV